jgi:hypothetical protein
MKLKLRDGVGIKEQVVCRDGDSGDVAWEVETFLKAILTPESYDELDKRWDRIKSEDCWDDADYINTVLFPAIREVVFKTHFLTRSVDMSGWVLEAL